MKIFSHGKAMIIHSYFMMSLRTISCLVMSRAQMLAEYREGLSADEFDQADNKIGSLYAQSVLCTPRGSSQITSLIKAGRTLHMAKL